MADCVDAGDGSLLNALPKNNNMLRSSWADYSSRCVRRALPSMHVACCMLLAIL